jgi:glutamate 5-kinase
MITKSTIAHKVAKLGIAVHIANGTKENILIDVLDNKVATPVLPLTKRHQAKRNGWPIQKTRQLVWCR